MSCMVPPLPKSKSPLLRSARGTNSNLPLEGWRVLVSRAREQAGSLSELLRAEGAEVLEIPFIEVRPPRSYKCMDDALRLITEYEWLILTSVNGVHALFERMEKLGIPKRRLLPLNIVAIGPATRAAIEKEGLPVAVMPKEYVAESVVQSLENKVRGSRVHPACYHTLDAGLAIFELLPGMEDVGGRVQRHGRGEWPVALGPGASVDDTGGVGGPDADIRLREQSVVVGVAAGRCAHLERVEGRRDVALVLHGDKLLGRLERRPGGPDGGHGDGLAVGRDIAPGRDLDVHRAGGDGAVRMHGIGEGGACTRSDQRQRCDADSACSQDLAGVAHGCGLSRVC